MEEATRLTEQIQDDLHLHLGLVQRKLSRMSNKPHRTVVQFRIMPERRRGETMDFSEYQEKSGKEKIMPNREDMFYLELGYRDSYADVVRRVANKLHVDRSRIRLALHSCYTNKPNPIRHNFVGHLFYMLLSSSKMCNVLYYKVLPDLKTNEAADDNPHANQVLGKRKVYHRSLVYHVTKTDGGEESMKPITYIGFCDDETIAEVKVKLLLKLAIHKDEFSKWRFALLQQGGQAEYLEDNNVLYGRLEGKGDQFLILEGPVVNDIRKPC